MVCASCGSSKLAPSAQRQSGRSRRCAKCINGSEAGKAARRRYMRRRRQTPDGQAEAQRRIRIGDRHVAMAATVAQAQAINAYIRQRVRAVTQAQRQERYAAESR